MYHRRGVDSGSVTRRLIKEFDRAGESEIGVFRAQERFGCAREILGNDDSRCLRAAHGSRIFRVRYEGNLSRGGFFNARYAGDFRIWGAILDVSVEGICKL